MFSTLHISDDFFLCQTILQLHSLQSLDKLLFLVTSLALVHSIALVNLQQVLDTAAQIR